MLPNCKLLTHLLIVTVLQFLINFADCEQSTSSSSSESKPRRADQVGNPWPNPPACRRFLPGYVCNPDLYFTPLQVSMIDPIIWKYSRTAPCLCDWCSDQFNNGITVGLAAMKDADRSSISDSSNARSKKQLTWKQYANIIRKKWHLGDCENDVIMVITPAGGGISFGELAGKILENSSLAQLKVEDFKKSRDEQFKLINDLLKEIQSYDLKTINRTELLAEIEKRKRTQPHVTEQYNDYDDDDVKVPAPESPNQKRSEVALPLSEKPPLIEDENSIVIAGSAPKVSSSSGTNTWGANSYIAAAENDEFKAPEEKRMSSSLAFMIVGSLTVILVSLIALFLIIWYYRTKTGNIEPNTMYTKPAASDEKVTSDIKAIKYEPCKTDEPGLPV